MAVGKAIREVRCDDVLKFFSSHNKGMCFLTLTTPDVVTLEVIRQRWRNLRHHLARRLGSDAKFVMNFELHPRGHGWHVHSVWNRFVNLRGGGLADLRRFGFRMINVKRVDSVGVAGYLSKHCLKAYRGVRRQLREGDTPGRLRLVNTSRGLPRLSDYHWQSEFDSRVREWLKSRTTKAYIDRFNLSWRRRFQYAQLAVLMGWRMDDLIEHFKRCNLLEMSCRRSEKMRSLVRGGLDLV